MRWLVGSAPKQYRVGCVGARPTPALDKLFRSGVLVLPCPRLLGEGRCLTGAPRRDLGHRSAVIGIAPAVSLDDLLLLAGQVGMIMAGFVPISGYKRSKNSRDGRI